MVRICRSILVLSRKERLQAGKMAEQAKKERMGEKERRKEIKGSTTSQNYSFNHKSNPYLLVSHTLSPSHPQEA